MNWKWFSVKTLYRWEPIGKPIETDIYFNDSIILVEERVLIFKARNHNESIKRAEKEASLYIKESFINPYGQKVITRRIKMINSYELFYDDLNKSVKSGTEVYSNTYVIDKSILDEEIINSHFGNDNKYLDGSRKLFLNRMFSGIVGSYEEHKKIKDE